MYQTIPVCTESQLKATIFLIGIIEVNASKHHALQQLRWWLDMPDSGLFGPVFKALNCMFVFHRNNPVLMPWDLPIQTARLVENQESDGTRARQKLTSQRG